jgi:hypothetical protein
LVTIRLSIQKAWYAHILLIFLCLLTCVDNETKFRQGYLFWKLAQNSTWVKFVGPEDGITTFKTFIEARFSHLKFHSVQKLINLAEVVITLNSDPVIAGMLFFYFFFRVIQ